MTDARIRMLELALDEQAERIERLRAAMPSEDDLAVYMLPHDLDRAALDAYLDELVTAIAALRDGDL